MQNIKRNKSISTKIAQYAKYSAIMVITGKILCMTSRYGFCSNIRPLTTSKGKSERIMSKYSKKKLKN